MDIKTLAQQYLREYRRTPELANWDSVIELGKQLAEAVLTEHGATIGPDPALVKAPVNLKLNSAEREYIRQFKLYGQRQNFILAVKSVRNRNFIGLAQAKAACDDYLASL